MPTRTQKVYFLHLPELERISRNASAIRASTVKVSAATTAHRSKGGQFVTHILTGNAHDGHSWLPTFP